MSSEGKCPHFRFPDIALRVLWALNTKKKSVVDIPPTPFTANTRHLPNVVLMLFHRLRCRPNFKTPTCSANGEQLYLLKQLLLTLKVASYRCLSLQCGAFKTVAWRSI